MKILVLGSEGMLGHVVKRYFEKRENTVFGTSRDRNNEYYFDVMENIHRIDEIIEKIKPDVVINCIGILNKVAEDNHTLAIMVNSYLPHYINELSIKENFKFIHVSTDCVFDGKKGKYNTRSFKDATSFYGRTKALGEIDNDRNLTMRTSIVGPDENPKGIGLFQWFMNQESQINGYSNVMWTGITTVQFAKCMEEAINNNLCGLVHAVNGEEISKYNLLELFKKYFKTNININKDESIVCNKSLVLGENDYKFDIPSYEKMIEEMKQWIYENKELYTNLISKIQN